MKRIIYAFLTAFIATLFTACNSFKENGVSSTTTTSTSESGLVVSLGDIIAEIDIESVIKSYSEKKEKVYDTSFVDIDFDGENELLVLASYGNNRRFSVWENKNGNLTKTADFGEGKVKWIDKISLKESEIDGERVFMFSFKFSGENSMEADVLSAIRKTANGYEVEHLLSHGTITYQTSEPFTKEFYRKGWSKYDLGIDGDFEDITRDEYNRLYEMFTKDI